MTTHISKHPKPHSVELTLIDRRIEEERAALKPLRKACALIEPAPVLLPSGTVRRISPRPLHARPKDFDDEYDGETLVYDAFWHATAMEIVLLGPPLCNLKPYFASMTVIS